MKWAWDLIKKKSHENGSIGSKGEDEVAKYVRKRGMRILARNWRHGRLELDMICEDGDTLVFIEVKTRQLHGKTSPIEGINAQKRTNFLNAAKSWLSKHDAWHRPCRFDVAGVLYSINEQNTTWQVEYYDNALDFSASTAVGGRNSSWQPW